MPAEPMITDEQMVLLFEAADGLRSKLSAGEIVLWFRANNDYLPASVTPWHWLSARPYSENVRNKLLDAVHAELNPTVF